VSKCKWGSFIQKAAPQNVLNGFVRDALEKYFQTHQYLIDYFTQNFFIRIGYENIPDIKYSIDAISKSNPDIYTLELIMNQKFNEEKWNELCMDTTFFKLTWKIKYVKKTKQGEMTFYGFICEQFGER
jgi:hypothetical protein